MMLTQHLHSGGISAMSDRARWILRIGLLIAAGGFIAYGAVREEVATVLTKAVNICLECIGLG